MAAATATANATTSSSLSSSLSSSSSALNIVTTTTTTVVTASMDDHHNMNPIHNNNNDDDDDDDEDEQIEGIEFVDYRDESQLDSVMSLVGRDLSEPYSIFTYRFFLYRFPQLCILAVPTNCREPVGCVVGKIDHVLLDDNINNDNNNNDTTNHTLDITNHTLDITTTTITTTTTTTTTATGYIGMLAVNENYRRRGIGQALVRRVLKRMQRMACTSVTLETEVSNRVAQKLYQDTFGFVREELLVRYYLNWSDAYRLRLWFR